MRHSDLVVTGRGLRFKGQYFPCSVGRGGCRPGKIEGDGVTPVGRHRIVGCLYRPDRIEKPVGRAIPIRVGDLWCDDPADPAYNHPVRAPYAASHEMLRRSDPLYDLILLTDWNWPDAQSGKGSGIFIHTWRKPRHPTEGCIGLGRDDLLWITAQITPETRLIVT